MPAKHAELSQEGKRKRGSGGASSRLAVTEQMRISSLLIGIGHSCARTSHPELSLRCVLSVLTRTEGSQAFSVHWISRQRRAAHATLLSEEAARTGKLGRHESSASRALLPALAGRSSRGTVCLVRHVVKVTGVFS